MAKNDKKIHFVLDPVPQPIELTLEGKVARAIEAKALASPTLVQKTVKGRRQIIRLARRDGKVCFHCGDPVRFTWEGVKWNAANVATFDHVITKKDGGSDDDENGVIGCCLCNGLRGHMSIEEFHKLLAEYGSPQEMMRRKKQATRLRKARLNRDRTFRIRFNKTFIFRTFFEKYSLITKPTKTKPKHWKKLTLGQDWTILSL